MKSSLENRINEGNALEHGATPENFSIEGVEHTHAEAIKNLTRITEGNPETQNKFAAMLGTARATALALALLGSVGNANAEDMPRERVDAGPTLEQTAPVIPSPDTLSELSVEQTNIIAETLSNEIGKFVDSKKESANTLTDSEKDIGQKLDASIDLVRTIPGLAGKIPALTVIETLRGVQEKLKNGASVKDIAVEFLGAAISAKTWGASDLLRNYLQAYEENRIAKGLPDITYRPENQQAP